MGQPSSSPKRRIRSVDPPDTPNYQPRDASPPNYPYVTRPSNNFLIQPTVSTFISKPGQQVTSPVKSPQTIASNNPNNETTKTSAELKHYQNLKDTNSALYFTGVFLAVKSTEKSSLQLQGRLELGYNLKTVQQSDRNHAAFDPFFDSFRAATDSYNVIQRKLPLSKVIDHENGRVSNLSNKIRTTFPTSNASNARESREPDLNTSIRSIVSIQTRNPMNNVNIPIEGSIHDKTINITLDETILRKLLGKTDPDKKYNIVDKFPVGSFPSRANRISKGEKRDHSEGPAPGQREDFSIRKDRNQRSFEPENRNMNDSFASNATAPKGQFRPNQNNETTTMPYRDEIYKEFYRDDGSMTNSQVSSTRKANKRSPPDPYNQSLNHSQNQRLTPNQNQFANQVLRATQVERERNQMIEQPRRQNYEEEKPKFQRSPPKEGKHMTFGPSRQGPPQGQGGYYTERNQPILTKDVYDPRADGAKTDRSRNSSFSNISNNGNFSWTSQNIDPSKEQGRNQRNNQPRISPEGAIANRTTDTKLNQARNEMKAQKNTPQPPLRSSPNKKAANVNLQRGGGGFQQPPPPMTTGKNQMANSKAPTNKPPNREILRLPTFSDDEMTASQIPTRSEIDDFEDVQPVKATLDLSNYNFVSAGNKNGLPPPRKASPQPQRADIALLKKLSDPDPPKKGKSASDKNAMRIINDTTPNTRGVSPPGYPTGNRMNESRTGPSMSRRDPNPSRKIVGEPESIDRGGTEYAKEFLQGMFDKLSTNRSDKMISVQSASNNPRGKPAERLTDRFGNRELPQNKGVKKSPGPSLAGKHSDELDHYGKKMLNASGPIKSTTPVSGKTKGQVTQPARTKQSPQRFELGKKGTSATTRNFY